MSESLSDRQTDTILYRNRIPRQQLKQEKQKKERAEDRISHPTP